MSRANGHDSERRAVREILDRLRHPAQAPLFEPARFEPARRREQLVIPPYLERKLAELRSARRPQHHTEEERRRVYELADAGWSSRAIAEELWNDRTLKDRVLRILARRQESDGRDAS